MRVIFFTSENPRTGIFRLKLDETPKYRLEYCTSQYTEISVPSSLTDVEETIWKITVTTGSSEPGIVLHGNGEEIVDMQLSDTVCEYGLWRTYWTKVTKKIQFTSYFQETDIYFHPTGEHLWSKHKRQEQEIKSGSNIRHFSVFSGSKTGFKDGFDFPSPLK